MAKKKTSRRNTPRQPSQGNQPQGPSYDQLKTIYLENMNRFGGLYSASKLMGGSYGKEGQANAWFVTRNTLREKIGIEGILENLDPQIDASIAKGGGLNEGFTVSKVIETNARIFEGCALALKAEDLTPYIKGGLGSVDVITEKAYINKSVAELIRSNDDKEKAYGSYLMTQLENSEMIKGNVVAYQERAKRANEEYQSLQKQVIAIQLPNGARINHKI